MDVKPQAGSPVHPFEALPSSFNETQTTNIFIIRSKHRGCMGKRSLILGMVIVGVVVAGATGASMAVDKVDGPNALTVSVERINNTHAAVSWTTDEATHGTLYTSTQHQCNGSWIAINSINASSFSRSHLVIAPIYELNRSRIELTRMKQENSFKQYMKRPPVRWHVGVEASKNGTAASKIIIQRNLSQTCQ